MHGDVVHQGGHVEADEDLVGSGGLAFVGQAEVDGLALVHGQRGALDLADARLGPQRSAMTVSGRPISASSSRMAATTGRKYARRRGKS
jgi:hypothetical protein